MRESGRIILFGERPEPRRQLGYTAVGLSVSTFVLLVGARVLGEWAVGIGGFLLLGLMILALVAGGYHAYRNTGLLWSLAPVVGLLVGVAAARVTAGLVFTSVPTRGLGVTDLAVVLLVIGGATVALAYGVRLVWRGESD